MSNLVAEEPIKGVKDVPNGQRDIGNGHRVIARVSATFTLISRRANFAMLVKAHLAQTFALPAKKYLLSCELATDIC